MAEKRTRPQTTSFNLKLPEWHGWHAARRGLGAILYRLGVPQKTVQAIFRHANVSTTNTYWIKSATDNTRAAVADLISDLLSHYGFWGYSLVLLELCRCSDGIWSGNELL